MVCCVRDVWCYCCELSGSVDVAFPVGSVLSLLLYVCAFQMNPPRCDVCVVTPDLGL